MRTIVIRVAIAALAACGQTEQDMPGVGPDSAPPATGDAAPSPSPDSSPMPSEPDAAPPVGGVDAAPVPSGCAVPGPAIVTDIDATLTISDNEFIAQLLDGSYVPVGRAGGAELISAYSERGYFVFYLTSRPEPFTMGGTGETAADATHRWLSEQGFPVEPGQFRLQLAPGLVFGDASAEYKAGALQGMVDEGFEFRYAYGNATSDIDAYETVGIGKDVTFIIGKSAGLDGTVDVVGEDWDEHAAEHVPAVPAICEW